MNKVVTIYTQWQAPPEGREECQIDIDRLAEDVESAVASLNEEGYEVVAITPITSAHYDASYSPSGDLLGGYGYSFTDAVLITARRMRETVR